MTTLITTSTIDSQKHNNIMAAGSRDRPPMLATGRYAQWQSRFLRYIDTRPNGDALRKCILEGPYTPSTVTIPVVPVTNDSPEVPKQTAVETILNMSPENKEHYQSKKEANHLQLTGIGDEIYSTIDACKTAHNMWISIERLQHGESLNIQDVKTNLFWEFGKFTSHDGESMESYYSRFYKMTNEMIRNNLTVTTMQVNYQKEVNEIRAEKIAKNANPLALVVVAQQYPDPYYQALKSHKSCAPPSKHSSSIKANASTKYKGKEIVKPITPPSESASEEDEDMDEEIDEQELEAHYNYMAKIQEVTIADSGTDTGPLEKVNSNVIPNSPDMCANDIHTNQNAEECDDKRVALANLIANLKLDVDENKKIQNQLKKANASLTHKLKECKSILAETSRTLEESNSTRDSGLIALQSKQTELETYKTLNDRTVDYDKLERKLNETLGLLAQKEIDIKEGLKLKAYEISVVKEKHDELVKQS
ncbi:hypothetical protein Tco_0758672 [Tanacetum coccineum]